MLSLYIHTTTIYLKTWQKWHSHDEKGPPCREKRSKRTATWRKSSKKVPYIADFFPVCRKATLAPPLIGEGTIVGVCPPGNICFSPLWGGGGIFFSFFHHIGGPFSMWGSFCYSILLTGAIFSGMGDV